MVAFVNLLIIIALILPSSSYGVDPSPTLMYRVHCPSTGHRLVLTSCSHDTDTISSHCTDANDVGVLCCKYNATGIIYVVYAIYFVGIKFCDFRILEKK